MKSDECSGDNILLSVSRLLDLENKEVKRVNDLISRQKTIKTIYYYFEDLIKTLPETVDSDSEKIIDISKTDEYLEIYKAIRELITILPSEKAKTGEWIIDGHHIKCNRCENIMCSRDREGDLIPRNFCPNCGTDMREGE